MTFEPEHMTLAMLLNESACKAHGISEDERKALLIDMYDRFYAMPQPITWHKRLRFIKDCQLVVVGYRSPFHSRAPTERTFK